MSKNSIVDTKEGCGSHGKMANDETVRFASSFLHHDKIGELGLLARSYKFVDTVCSSVNSCCIGDE